MNMQAIEPWLAALCFGYPYVMAWYWMVGGALFHLVRERREPRSDRPPLLEPFPPLSVLVPCHNEMDQIDETIAALRRVAYPDFEIVVIDDGSTDGTWERLQQLAADEPRLRTVRLARNCGKAMALNAGALAARHEILVCIDGDTLIDANALTWFARGFQHDASIGGISGNPRIRNRASLLGRVQVGEFSSIVGLIKRAQSVYGALFTVSGAVCAFRKHALHEAGWWSADTATDDVHVSWRLQMVGWRMVFEPNALGWILMPETLGGFWKQRLRWSEGGSAVAIRMFPQLFTRCGVRMWPVWLNWMVSVIWAYAVLVLTAAWLLSLLHLHDLVLLEGLGFIPGQAGMILALHYLLQAVISAYLDRRYERGMLRGVFWIVWYPLAFWVVQAATTVVGFPRALLSTGNQGEWISPDRGFRP